MKYYVTYTWKEDHVHATIHNNIRTTRRELNQSGYRNVIDIERHDDYFIRRVLRTIEARREELKSQEDFTFLTRPQIWSKLESLVALQ